MHPLISVVMPVYNIEAYVAEAIESVLAQTLRSFELIIVDDGSTDRSAEICRSYDDIRIQVVSQKNRGLAGARNTGIQHSRGKFIAFLDSDDRWQPEKLELHFIHLMANPHIGVSYSGSRFIDADGQPMRIAQRPRLQGITPEHIFCRNPIGNGSAPVIRRADLDRVAAPHPAEFTRLCYFDESLRQSEDIDMWMRLALMGDTKFEGIPGLLTEYRVISGGLSAQVVRQYQSWEYVVERLREIAPDFVNRHANRAKAYQLRYLARRMVQLGDPGMAVALLKESFQSSRRPFFDETMKSLATYFAAVLGTKVSPEIYARMLRFVSGGRLVS